MTPESITVQLEQSANLIAAHSQSIADFAKRVSTYYTGVSRETVILWLLQFRHPERVEDAIQLLQHVHFVDQGKLCALLSRGLQKIPPKDRSVLRYAALGRAFDSASVTSYALGKILDLSEHELAAKWMELSDKDLDAHEGAPIALIDDNVTSGIQLCQALSELSPDYIGKREHSRFSLSPNAYHILRCTPLYAVVAVELSDSSATLQRFCSEHGFALTVVSGLQELAQWLEYGNSVWPSPSRAQSFRAFAELTARRLFAEKTDWSPEKLDSRLLGYGNLQKLTVFAHNVPKSLIPLFWKFGRLETGAWIPLFPERTEWHNHRSEIEVANPELRVLAKLIAEGGIGRPVPACQAFIELDGEPHTLAPLAVGDPSLAQGLVEHQLRTLDLSPGNTEFGGAEYSKALAQYRDEVHKYLQSLKRDAAQVLRLAPVSLRIYNNGTGIATEVLLRMFLPPSIQFADTLPKPPDPPIKPKPFDYATFRAFPGRHMSPVFARPPRVRLARDRGRDILNVFIGKILPGTFHDRLIEYLAFGERGEHEIEYQIICQEATLPQQGFFRFLVTFKPHQMQEYVPDEWRVPDDDD